MAPRGCQCPALLPPAWGTPSETSPESVSSTATLSPSVRVGRALRPRIVGVCQMPAVDPMSGGHRHVQGGVRPSPLRRSSWSRPGVHRTGVRSRDPSWVSRPWDTCPGPWYAPDCGATSAPQVNMGVRPRGASMPGGTPRPALGAPGCVPPCVSLERPRPSAPHQQGSPAWRALVQGFTSRLGHPRRTLDGEVGRTEHKDAPDRERLDGPRTSVEVVAHQGHMSMSGSVDGLADLGRAA